MVNPLFYQDRRGSLDPLIELQIKKNKIKATSILQLALKSVQQNYIKTGNLKRRQILRVAIFTTISGHFFANYRVSHSESSKTKWLSEMVVKWTNVKLLFKPTFSIIPV